MKRIAALALAALITIGLPALAFQTCIVDSAAVSGPKCGIGTSPTCPAKLFAAVVPDAAPAVAQDAGVPAAGPKCGIGTSPTCPGVDIETDPAAYAAAVLKSVSDGAWYVLSVLLLIGAVQFARIKGLVKDGYRAIIASVLLGALATVLAALTSGVTAVATLVAAFVTGALKGLEAAGVVRLVQKRADAKAAAASP